jgi:hypothetical protein
MEEKNVKTGFWSEYFKSLGNHPFRTTIITVVIVDGIVSIIDCVFGRSK